MTIANPSSSPTISAGAIDRVLKQRLEARSAELERVALDRVFGIGGPVEATSAEYRAGLRAAVPAALFYAIGGIGATRSSVPQQLRAQARQAARHSVSLDTVIRRYFAGYALLNDILVEECGRAGLASTSELRRVMRVMAGLFDRLVAAVTEEYSSEAERAVCDRDRRRFEHVRRLLAGELSDPGELGYELGGWHLAALISGSGAAEALRRLALALDSRLLIVRQDERTAWVWLGSERKPSVRGALRLVESTWPAEASLAFGEAGEGLHGWRLSHRQAVAAMSVAQRGVERVVCYADVSMLASALRDEVLLSSLRETYLAPLEGARDGGATARDTLSAYITANRNVSSAAAALGVSRKTVTIRLRTAEELIGRPLERCAPELETALRLRDLTQSGKLASHIGPGNASV